MAQSPENLNPSDTVEPDANWSSISGNHTSDVTDGTDGNYVYAVSAGEVERFEFANISGMPSDATVDSIGVRWRGQDTGSGNNRQRLRLRMDGSSNFCDGANQSLTTSWVDYEEFFTQAPSSAGACGNSWGTGSAKPDSVNVQLTCTALGGGREVQVTELDVDVYYTEPSTGTGRRRRLLQIGAVDEAYEYFLAQMITHNSDEITGVSKGGFWWAS